jgi:hypothetical protein
VTTATAVIVATVVIAEAVVASAATVVDLTGKDHSNGE